MLKFLYNLFERLAWKGPARANYLAEWSTWGPFGWYSADPEPSSVAWCGPVQITHDWLHRPGKYILRIRFIACHVSRDIMAFHLGKLSLAIVSQRAYEQQKPQGFVGASLQAWSWGFRIGRYAIYWNISQ